MVRDAECFHGRADPCAGGAAGRGAHRVGAGGGRRGFGVRVRSVRVSSVGAGVAGERIKKTMVSSCHSLTTFKDIFH